MFPTNYNSIWERVLEITPDEYGKTRNFKDGKTTFLGPYLSRGVISTKQVLEHLLSRDLPWYETHKLIQELAWRDYHQQIWKVKGNAIDSDLKSTQEGVDHFNLPSAIVNAKTGISAIDEGLVGLIETGHMHNHMRMYVASMACNTAKAHWNTPAKWMYSHLLDGDWASNAISWQWVAGTHSSKKYYANQDNINRFFYSDQKNTFLDHSYEELPALPTPNVLMPNEPFQLKTVLPESDELNFSEGKKIAIYNYYNLDPIWRKEEDLERVLLLEPSHFNLYPISSKCLDFMLDLSKNITNLKVFSGEFNSLKAKANQDEFIFKEHPTTSHYIGQEDPRDWMFKVEGYYSSFFKFWKKCSKTLNNNHLNNLK
ncbi:MAG: FAD-binding domain-containing protein [Flavobacteriales bacterium]